MMAVSYPLSALPNLLPISEEYLLSRLQEVRVLLSRGAIERVMDLEMGGVLPSLFPYAEEGCGPPSQFRTLTSE